MQLACESEWAAGAVSVGSAHRQRRAGGLRGRETNGYLDTTVIKIRLQRYLPPPPPGVARALTILRAGAGRLRS
jgi:hypothetical protein